MDFSVDSGFIFCIEEEINTDLHCRLAVALHAINRASVKRVRIILSTEGGDDHVAFGIYDLLSENKKPVDIVVNGPCLSAGTLIVQAGTRRLATAHSQFQFHYGEPSVSSTPEMKFQMQSDTRWINLIARRAKMPVERCENLHAQDSWLTAHHAFMLGLIDEVVKKVL